MILAIVLAATGLGLMRVTTISGHENHVPQPTVQEARPAPSVITVPYRLLLSAPASSLEIDTGKIILAPVTEGQIAGTLAFDPMNPHLALRIRWKNEVAVGEHRFAKLTLEAPGQETFTHVFDADGEINDFLELPFPTVK